MNKFRSRLELHTAQGRAVLASAMEVRVMEELNGNYYVTFAYPREEGDEERYEGLILENEVRFPPDIERGQHFAIKSVEEIRQGRKIYKVVEAHHVAFELSRFYLDDYIEFLAAQPPAAMLALLGNGTPFQMAVQGSFQPEDVFDFGEAQKNDLLQTVRAMYNAELEYDNYTITLTTRAGANRGAEIRYRKNMAGIKRKLQNMERVTRLYGYGKNGLTIEGLPGYSVKYIDSPHFDPSRPYEGKVEFPEIEDKAALLSAMQKHLRDVEIPKATYDVEFVQLEKVDAEYLAEQIRGAGDTVTVRDEEMGYHFDARVQTFERYPFEPKRGRVSLANFRELTEADYIFRATVASKKAMVYTSKNAVLKGVKYDDSITLVDGIGITVSDDLERIRAQLGQIAPGEYGVVLFNKAGARTVWQDAETGDARYSGRVIASIVEGGQVIGAIIQGGTVTGATVQTSASFPKSMMNIVGNRLGVYTDAQTNIEFMPGILGEPGIVGTTLGESSFSLGSTLGLPALHGYKDLSLSSDRSVKLRPGSGFNVEVPDWTRLFSVSRQQTLQQHLDFMLALLQLKDTSQDTRMDGLQTQIDNLTTALDNKSEKGHTHDVTTAHHNHGNLQNNPNTGGGTYRTTGSSS
ncbi:phage tail spike protein [Paenibacillus daejeonensis]|uniref:phage tail spike protein n=1 Tax=Paenibacillus daejeonensis TaxID=135193 RepID=UPI00037A8C8E|nr:phage tail spike protein [Paenibacillus daejeonensis]